MHLIAILTCSPPLLMDANVALTRANLEHLAVSDFMNPALQVGFRQLSRSAMDQPLPAADDDWLALIADYVLSNRDELFLREEIIQTTLRLRVSNLAREQESLYFMISEQQQARMMPIAPEVQENSASEVQGNTDQYLRESLALYNAKLQQVASQKLRAQKALRLRSALSPS